MSNCKRIDPMQFGMNMGVAVVSRGCDGGTFQMKFQGQGFVVIQPCEETSWRDAEDIRKVFAA